MTPTQSDDHWFLLVLGHAAMVAQIGASFVCAAFIVMPVDGVGGGVAETGEAGIGHIIGIFAVAFLLNIIQIFVHEMGHALAAWSVKRRVHLICVGIIGYAPDIRKFMFLRKPDNAEYAGFVMASPVWPDLGPGKSIWVSVGGPLATGGLGALFLIMFALGGALSPALLSLSVFFMLDAVVNLLPLRWSRGSGSDGLHILGYLGGESWSLDAWAQTRLDMAEFSPTLISDEEWHHLKPLKGGPFNSEVLNKLIERVGR